MSLDLELAVGRLGVLLNVSLDTQTSKVVINLFATSVSDRLLLLVRYFCEGTTLVHSLVVNRDKVKALLLKLDGVVRLSDQIQWDHILCPDALSEFLTAKLYKALEHEIVGVDQEVQPDAKGLRLLKAERISVEILEQGAEVGLLDAFNFDDQGTLFEVGPFVEH